MLYIYYLPPIWWCILRSFKRQTNIEFHTPVRRKAIPWANVDLFSILPSGTNTPNEIWIKIGNLSFNKMHLKMPVNRLFLGSGPKTAISSILPIYCSAVEYKKYPYILYMSACARTCLCVCVINYIRVEKRQPTTTIWLEVSNVER